MTQSTKSEIYLLLITACLGLTFPLLHQAVQHTSPAQLVFERFALSACLLLPFILRQLHKTTGFLLLSGMILGLISIGTYFFQTISLETISASRAAFLTGSSVLLVPFLAPLFGLQYPKPIHFISCTICLFGLYVITDANLRTFVIGDLWGMSGTVCVALLILTVQWLTARTQDYLLLTFYQILFTTVFAFFPLRHHAIVLFHLHPSAWLAIIFCAIFATVIASFVQLRFQQYTTATKAGLIFALEPIFASVFDCMITHNRLSHIAIIGGTIMMVSIVLPDVYVLYLKHTRHRAKLASS